MGKIKAALLLNPIYWVISLTLYLGWAGPFLVSAAFTPAVILGFILPFVLAYWLYKMASVYTNDKENV